MALYNIGIGAVSSGIGAIINKKTNEKWGKVFLKGMYQGSLGGLLVYQSKVIVGKIPDQQQQQWKYAWGAKIINAAGVSIIENASSNRNFWEQWNFHLGFNRVEFHTKGGFKIKYKIMPISLAMTIGIAINKKFEIDKTIEMGEIIFSTQNIDNNDYAYTFGYNIVMNNSHVNNYTTYSHEIIHIYQLNDFNFINTYYDKLFLNWKNKSKPFNKINNFLYLDMQIPVHRSFYLLENQESYYNNFFEYEARFYSKSF